MVLKPLLTSDPLGQLIVTLQFLLILQLPAKRDRLFGVKKPSAVLCAFVGIEGSLSEDPRRHEPIPKQFWVTQKHIYLPTTTFSLPSTVFK